MATSEFDFRSLEEEFALPTVIQENNTHLQNIGRDRDSTAANQGDAETILRLNIERANFLLDQAELDINNGAVNARTLEACARIISEVTNAANSLKNLEIQSQTLDLKERTLNLKDFEIKSKLANNKESDAAHGDVYNTQIIYTNREQLLDMLEETDITIDVENKV